jgi:hypothetical protein
MVTGELPFKSNGPLDAWMKKINNEIEPPRKLIPTVSERLDWAIRRSISPDPVHRPESCQEFIEDLTGHGTKTKSGVTLGVEAITDYWYMVYTDDEGTVHTVKGTTKAIRRSLKEGLLGDAENVRVARKKIGPFEPLKHFPEFRDLVVHPAKLPTPAAESLDAGAEKPAPSVSCASVTSAPANPSDSAILSTTTILPLPAATQATAVAVKASSREGPCINLKAPDSSESAEIWKWIILGLVFVSAGVVATFLPALVRHFRLF